MANCPKKRRTSCSRSLTCWMLIYLTYYLQPWLVCTLLRYYLACWYLLLPTSWFADMNLLFTSTYYLLPGLQIWTYTYYLVPTSWFADMNLYLLPGTYFLVCRYKLIPTTWYLLPGLLIWTYTYYLVPNLVLITWYQVPGLLVLSSVVESVSAC